MSVTEATLFTVSILFRSGAMLRGENVPADRVAAVLAQAQREPTVTAVAVEMQESQTTEYPSDLRACGVH